MGFPDEPDTPDLTPGDFRMGFKRPMEMDTQSLHGFGMSYAINAEAYFGGLATSMSRMIVNSANRDAGSRPFGNDTTGVLDELVTVADYGKTAATTSETLTIDLTYGCVALGNGAAWAAEQAGTTDGFNGVTLSAIESAFNPPKDANLAADERRQTALTRAQDAAHRATLPVVDPYDVHFYLMSGKKPGVDFIIAGSPPVPTGGGTAPTNSKDPTGSGNPGNTSNGGNNGGNTNPFYKPTKEDDYDEGYTGYMPPEPPMEDEDEDTDIVAPGPIEPGPSPTSNPTVVA